MPTQTRTRQKRSMRRRGYSWEKSSLLVEQLEERLAPATGIFTVGDSARTIDFDWTLRDAAYQNEIGIFEVDDESGRIDGLSPGQAGYASAAIARADVIFGSGQGTGAHANRSFDAGALFAVYLVQNSSTAHARQANPNNSVHGGPVVFFSIDSANPDGIAHARSNGTTASSTSLALEDQTGGGDRDYNDAILSVGAALVASATTPSNAIKPLIHLPGESSQSIAVTFRWTFREAGYNNELGLYLASDANGTVNGIRPGDPSYRDAVLHSPTHQVVFASGQTAGAEKTLTFAGGSYIGLYFVVNSSSAQAASSGSPVYFSFAVANSDGFDHLRDNGNGEFAWEDFPGGGDQDFNDMVGQVLIGEPVGETNPSDTTAPAVTLRLQNDTGASSTDTITFDPTIAATVTDDSAVKSVEVAVDSAAQASFHDVTSYLQAGQLALDRAKFEEILGGPMVDRQYSLYLRARDDAGNISPIAEFSFVLDTTLATPTFDLTDETDSPPPGDQTTSFETVDLVGSTDPGVTLSLEEFGRQTTSGEDGSFSFEGLHLLLGSNPLTVVATDIAGNRRFFRTEITRDECDFQEEDWTIDTAGSGETPGLVTFEDCTALLQEGSSFVVELERDFVVPEQDSLLTFTFTDLDFDMTDESFINDAFEVAFVDQDGFSLLPTISPDRDAFFNITEDLPDPVVGDTSIITVTGNTVTVDLSDVPEGSQGKLIFRLVNNDSDTETSVLLTQARIIAAPTPGIGETKFFVADFSAGVYRHNDAGDVVGSFASGIPAADLRGASSIADGSSLWTIASDGTVIVQRPDGSVRGTWTAYGTVDPEGIEVVGDDVWVVDADLGKALRYAGAASYVGGIAAPASSFALAGQNVSPTGIASSGSAGSNLWVVDDVADRIFVYDTAGTLVGMGALDNANADPSDITTDPSGGAGFWVLDRADHLVYAYAELTVPENPSSLVGMFALDAANTSPEGLADPTTASSNLQLTEAGIELGFTISTFATGFPKSSNIGPLGIAFPDSGGVLVVDYLGNVWHFPSTEDGQSTAEVTPVNHFGLGGAIDLTKINGSIYMSTRSGGGRILKLSDDGTTSEAVVTGLGTTNGIAPSPFLDELGHQHLYVGVTNGIRDVDLTTKTSTFVVTGANFDGVSTDGNVVYGANANSGHVLGYSIATHEKVFDSGAIVGGVDGTALGNGSLAGYIFVNTNTAGFWRVDLATTEKVQIADGPSATRGDFVAVAPDGSLLLTQSAEIDRLTPPTGGGFGAFDLSITATAPSDQSQSGSTILLSGNAESLRVSDGATQTISTVYVNNVPVDVLDSAGNFFAQVVVNAGVNNWTFTATDALGQTASTTVTIFGTTSTGELDLSRYADITDTFEGVYYRTSFNEKTKQLYVNLATKNTGAFDADIPLLVGVRNISRADVQLLGADGVMPDGTPYIDFTKYVTGGRLGQDQQTASPSIAFSNPSREQFTYELVFYAKLNDPPQITTVPDIEALAGHTYTYDVDASDIDEDPLAYSLEVGATGMQIDRDTGVITWTPSEDQIGNHNVVVLVDDARDGLARQKYLLSVIAAPPNRPPVFVTTPVTDGNVGVAYSYDSEAEDSDGDILTYSFVEDDRHIVPAGMDIDPSIGLITWTPAAYQVGQHAVTIQADDGLAGIATQTFVICVEPDPNNHAPIIVSSPVTDIVSQTESAEAVAVDLSGWQQVTIANTYGFGDSNANTAPNWQVGTPATSVKQLVNANASMLLSDFTVQNDMMEGTWRVEDTGVSGGIDDDFMGFVFGYQDPQHFYLFDWKRAAQSFQGATASAGMTVKRVDADSPLTVADLWDSSGTSGRVTAIYHNETPWVNNTDYSFRLSFHEGQFSIEVKQGTSIVASISIDDGTYSSGKFGFYNYSQAEVLYKGFTRQRFQSNSYSYDVDAVDPDDDDITYSIVSGPTGMSIDSATGLITWSTALGANLVTNGDFEDGYTGFSTQLRSDISPGNAGSYRIDTDPFKVYGSINPAVGSYGDHTSGSGKMLVANGSTNPTAVNWEETIAVEPGKTYEFYAWASTTYDVAPAQLRFQINGVTVGEPLTLPTMEGEWQRFYVRWNSGAATSATIRIINDQNAFIGNDFALDDIGFSEVFTGGTFPVVVRASDGRGGVDEQTFTIEVTAPGTGEVDGTTFGDLDGNTEQSESEPVLAGWTIYLDQNQNGIRDEGERFTVTGQDALPDVTHFYGPLPYLQRADSPFASLLGTTDFWLEDFEDGALNVPGVTASSGVPLGVLANTPIADSVDEDDGVIDGHGNDGACLAPINNDIGSSALGVTFEFDASVLGFLPTHVGIVWTDGSPDDTLVFEAFGPDGELLGTATGQHIGDGSFNGLTAEDRFVGVVSATGISAIHIHGTKTNQNAFAVDHLQYGRPSNIGGYSFTGLPDGTYYLREEPQQGWTQTSPVGGVHVVTIADGLVVSGIDFGNRQVDGSTNQAPEFQNQTVPTAIVGGLFRYDANALDPENDPLSYRLVDSPDGMTLNPQTGTVVWIPRGGQLGTHGVTLAVDDGNGGFDLLTFVVTVESPNHNPVFIRQPSTQAIVDMPYRQIFAAQDPDGDTLTYALKEGAPAGMEIVSEDIRDTDGTLLSTVYRLVWTPGASDLSAGSRDITIVASDGRGGVTELPVTIQILASAPNADPTITSSPRNAARAGVLYVYMVEANDPDGDPLTYTLENAPSGMTVSSMGVVRWTPTGTETDAVQPMLVVSDGRGGQATQDIPISVVSQTRNTAPVIVSNPVLAIRMDDAYAYSFRAEDAEGDPILWTLDKAPLGMWIDSETQTLRWEPNADQKGSFEVILRATDPFLVASTQSFFVTVNCVDQVPLIRSTPPTEAFVGERYIYAVRATDPENDTLKFYLETMPSGMTINVDTGLLQWTPTSASLGPNNAVVIHVDDGHGGTAIQQYKITVSDATNRNRAPVITSLPVFSVTADDPYVYEVSASDADGDSLTFGFDEGPNGPIRPEGMTIDESTGKITWNPTEVDEGTHEVSIVVRDPSGASARQGFVINVRVNSAPQITPIQDTEIAGGATFRQTVRAIDVDHDPLTYQLIGDIPDGMTIDGYGRIIWKTSADVTEDQDYPITVRVSDPRGAFDEATFVITLTRDTTPPVVNVLVGDGMQFFVSNPTINVGSIAQFEVTAYDNTGIRELRLEVDGQLVPLTSTGLATLAMNIAKDVTVVATAIDLAGNSSQSMTTIAVVGRGGGVNSYGDVGSPPLPFDAADKTAPTVHIVSPTFDKNVEFLTPVVATIDDPEDRLWFWQVFMARVDQVNLNNFDRTDLDYRVLATGFGEVDNAEVAMFDPTTLTNDGYVIWVAAFDCNGQGYVDGVTVNVVGNAKLGEFRLELTDLSIPLSGIPINVSRVYDTRTSGDIGDFGYGWTLGIQDARILETGARGVGGAFFGGNNSFVAGQTKVYLTNPAGERVGFTYQEKLVSASFFGGIAKPYFVPDSGVYDALEVDGQVAIGGIIGALGGGFNPSVYTLTTKEGTKYIYDQNFGLQKIIDLNGNTVTFTHDGILHSSGQSIQFVRDSRDRITQIIDPAGNKIVYTYNAKGELQAVTRQNGERSTYSYINNPPHYLDEAFDANGFRDLKVLYDDHGRFDKIIDALGNTVSQQNYDEIANRTGIVRDANGNETRLVFNDRGNVIEEHDPEGNVTYREYQDAINPDSETKIIDKRGFATEREYDAKGNVLQITETGSASDPFDVPLVTKFTYDSHNNVTSITNAMGNTTKFTYDSKNNLTKITNALGFSATFTYDTLGRKTSYTDFDGNLTTYVYSTPFCGCVGPKEVIFKDGTKQVFDYNSFGQVIYEAFLEADGTVVEQSWKEYDASGRLILEKDGTGNVVRMVYDGDLLDYEIVVNPETPNETPATPVGQRKSRITDYEYDAAGRVIRQTDANGGVVEFRYDAQGNRILLQDPVGNITTWVYDSLNRIVEERDPLYWVDFIDQHPSDFAGLSGDALLSEVVEANALASGADAANDIGAPHVLVSAYDAEGNLSKKIDRDGRATTYAYDHVGRMMDEYWWEGDTTVEHMEYRYDAVGNLTFAKNNASQYVYTYDALNRQTSVDNAGTPDVPKVILTYGYDNQGNIITTSDNFGVTVTSTYNSRNLLETRSWSDEIVAIGEDPDVDPVRVEFYYNAAGREIRLERWADIDGDGQVDDFVGYTTTTYDLAGRTNTLVHKNAVDEVLSGYDYDYDYYGLVIKETRDNQDDQYDEVIDYTYDLTGQLTDVDYENDTQPDEYYRYDANGNRTSSYLHGNGYMTGPGNRLLSDGTFNYSYDDEGNMIKKVHIATGETTTYVYDHHNHLVHVDDWSSDPGDPEHPTVGVILTQSVEYTYDVLGRRIISAVDSDVAAPEDSSKTLVIYNGDNAWADINVVGEVVARYLFGNTIDTNIARFRPREKGTSWYLNDKLETVRDLLEANGTIINHNYLSGFGLLIETTNADASDRFAFAGRELDSPIDLYNYRTRQYTPQNGRFLSTDPIGFQANDPNLYRMAANNTVSRRDPRGTTATIEFATLSTAISGSLILAREFRDGEPCTGVPNSPFGYPFSPGCLGHDSCYDGPTSGNSREECDKAFYQDLLRSCKNNGFGLGCKLTAYIYFLGVRIGGSWFYIEPAPGP